MQSPGKLITNDLLFIKMTDNYTSRFDQYAHEYQTWGRMLEFYKQESAFLKTRLSKVVDSGIDKKSLVLAEHFQNQFIIRDDFIIELRRDINAMGAAIKGDSNAAIMKYDAKQNKLRSEISYLEKSFSQLKDEFNKYLLSIVK